MSLNLVPSVTGYVPNWRLAPDAMYRIDGFDYRLLESDGKAHSFQATAKPYQAISLSQPDFVSKHESGAIEIEPHFLSRQKSYLRTLNKDFRVRDLAPREQERVLFAYLLCQGYELMLGEKQRGLRSEKVNLGKACLSWLLPKVQAELVAAHNENARKGDDLRFSKKLPSSRQFVRDWRKYEACRTPAAFARLYRGSSTRRKNANPVELHIRRRIQAAYACPKRPTEAALLKRYIGILHRLNRGLKAQGQPLLTAVSRKTFSKGIAELDPFHVTMMREDKKAALARFGTGSGGFGQFRPLERVEFDEWLIDLQTLLVDLAIWKDMTPKERMAVTRTRLWVTVAMDTATRCVLAFKIHAKDPCADTAIEVLELALTDKSRIADYVGAACSYPYSGEINTILPDNGSAFRSTAFLTAANDAGAELLLPQAGTPQARAHLERSFRTFSNQALHWFAGRTFSNVLEKGNANPEKAATVCADQFAKGFYRYMIDQYHHTPHSGLGGETPHDAWMRLTAKYPIRPGLSRDNMRRTFGLEFKRKVSSHGIPFLALPYNSRQLQGHVGETVLFRVNRYDLTKITFWDGRHWIDVDCELPVPENLTVYELEYAKREFDARFAGNKEMHLDFVADAAAALREIGHASDVAAGISVLADRASERDRLNRLDRERFGFRIKKLNAAPAEPRRLLDLTRASDSDGEVFDLPAAYRDSPVVSRPDRYDFKDDVKGKDQAAEPQFDDDHSSSHDDNVDIDFE